MDPNAEGGLDSEIGGDKFGFPQRDHRLQKDGP